MKKSTETSLTVNLYTNNLLNTRLFYESLLDLDLDYRLNERESSFDFYFGKVHFSFNNKEEYLKTRSNSSSDDVVTFSMYFEPLEELELKLKEMKGSLIKTLHSSGPFEKIVFSDPNGYIFDFYRES